MHTMGHSVGWQVFVMVKLRNKGHNVAGNSIANLRYFVAYMERLAEMVVCWVENNL